LLLIVPFLPFSIVNRVTTRLLNASKFNFEAFIFNKSKKTISSSEQTTLFPSDIAKKWNRAFGRAGLMEYQFSFPFGKEMEAEKILRDLATHVSPALAAIKIFGPGNKNYLSFPSEGYVVGITFPWKKKYLQIITKLDDEISEMGFKKYLSKDVFTKSHHIHEMYPELGLFLKFKKSIDPQEVFVSDLYKRIFNFN
jgi:decaprenylphospho-beta-D-ribofuranose 2-oxidase